MEFVTYVEDIGNDEGAERRARVTTEKKGRLVDIEYTVNGEKRTAQSVGHANDMPPGTTSGYWF